MHIHQPEPDRITPFLDYSSEIAEELLNPPVAEQEENRPVLKVGEVKVYNCCSLIRMGRSIQDRKPGEGVLGDLAHMINYVVFKVIGGVMKYLVGQNFSLINVVNKELRKVRIFRQEVLSDSPDNEKNENLCKVADTREQIFKRIRRDAAVRLVLTVAVVAAAALAATAAFVTLPGLMIAAYAFAGATVGGIAIRSAIAACQRNKPIEDAEQIQKYRRLYEEEPRLPLYVGRPPSSPSSTNTLSGWDYPINRELNSQQGDDYA